MNNQQTLPAAMSDAADLHTDNSTRADDLSRPTAGDPNASRKRPRSSLKSQPGEVLPPRSGRACTRCRRMKLRCVGDFPCIRCTRAHQPCGDEGDDAMPEPSSLDRRSSPINSLHPPLTQAIPNSNPAHTFSSLPNLSLTGNAPHQSLPDHTATDSFGMGVLAGSMETRSRQQLAPSFTFSPNSAVSHNSLLGNQTQQPFTDHSLSLLLAGPSRQPLPSSSDGLDLSSSRMSISQSSQTNTSHVTLPPGVRDTPENRLAIARESSLSQAAFRPLLIQSTAWGYTEASRPPSPGNGEGNTDYGGLYGEQTFMEGGFDGKVAVSSDPVNEGILDQVTADLLVHFFFEKCHQFMPIIHLPPDPSSSIPQSLRKRSSFLYTVVLAIGARIYPRHASRFKPPDTPSLPAHIPGALRQMAYSHLAATILRKQQNFGDLQSILILSVWGLLGQGKGPDPWLLTGMVQRLSHRLELYRASLSPVVRRIVDGGETVVNGMSDKEKEMLHKVTSQWRASLACFYFDSYLSLGFGRPLSVYNEPLNDELFIQLSQARGQSTSLAADMYLVSQVQLARISRDFVFQAKCLNELRLDPTTPSGSQFGPDFSVCIMLIDLNKRLDDWDFRWSWNGSLNVLQMGPNRRFAKLQAQHVRLSVNSVALRSEASQNSSSAEDTQYLAACVIKATEAAISMIDMHLDAVQSDFLFSYSFEYITNALAQAALFVIRLYVAQDPSPAQRPVLFHYLKSAVEVIENSDMSVTGHSTTVARILRDLIRAAGISLEGEPGPIMNSLAIDQDEMNKANGNSSAPFDFDAFLQMDALEYDYGFLFDTM